MRCVPVLGASIVYGNDGRYDDEAGGEKAAVERKFSCAVMDR
jgi:hypothetical protein